MHVTVDFHTDTCIQCGVVFGLPIDLDERRKEDGRWIYCPNGHKQKYTSLDKRIEEVEAREQKLREDNQRLRDELAKLKQTLEVAEAKQATKAKK